MQNRKRFGLLAGFAVVSALVPTDKSQAATILYTTGFESATNTNSGYPGDTYKSGSNLANTSTTTGNGADAYVQAVGDASSPDAAITQYGVPAANPNKQFAYIAAADEDAGAISTFSPSAAKLPTVTPGTSTIDVVFQLNSAPGFTGDPFFGVVAKDAAGNNLVGIGEDGSTGDIVSDDYDAASPTGDPNYTGTAAATPGTFNAFMLQLNYGTQKYNVYEGPASGGSFTPSEIIDSGSFSATTFGTFALTSFSLDQSATADASGFGEFDNITVSEIAAVPEPAACGLFVASGVVALLRRRRAAL